jgi:hypothetical protein
MPRLQRKSIPVPIQVEVLFRDRWLCHLCRRPLILHLALKQLADLAQETYPDVPFAYWQKNWRRDASPLLDELAASVDHIKAFAAGGAHDISNFAAVCARCNARKSAKIAEAFLSESRPWRVKGKHGEPTHWDGLSAVFVHLARQRQKDLSAMERQWLRALELHFATTSSERAV